MRSPLLAVSLLFIAACPEPPSGGPPGLGPNAGGPGGPGGGPPGPPGQPGGQGGQGGAPPAGGGAAGGKVSGSSPPPAFDVAPGEGVKLSGTLTWSAGSGVLRIDVLQPFESGINKVLAAVTIDKPGAWELEVPKDLGSVTVSAFVDYDGNGPGPTEPMVEHKGVAVAGEAIAGLDFDLDQAKPSGVTPGGGAPPAGGAAAGGGAGAPQGGSPGAPQGGGNVAPPGGPAVAPQGGGTGAPPAPPPQ